jgi:hypothetical protein
MSETQIDLHAINRLNQRLDLMANNHDISTTENDLIRRNINNVLSHDFCAGKDYGIFLGSFTPNPKSSLYTDKNEFDPNIPFYTIDTPKGHRNNDDILCDSTGDEFWGIVRKNRLKTVMLRKRLQRRSAAQDRMNGDGGLGVDKVIMNFDSYLENLEKEAELKRQAELKALEAERKTKSINGVKWQIDDTKAIIYKKNNPDIFVKYDDIFDYSDWDNKTREDILDSFD